MDTDIRAILSAIPRGEEAARLPHQELVQVLDSVVSIALQLARRVKILQEENRLLREQVRVLTEQINTLQEQNYALLRRLNTNSCIPSSKDPPWYTDNQGNAGTQIKTVPLLQLRMERRKRKTGRSRETPMLPSPQGSQCSREEKRCPERAS